MPPLRLRIADDLGFELRDLPDALREPIASHLAAFVVDLAVPSPIVIEWRPPPAGPADEEPVLEQPPISVARRGGLVLFRAPGAVGWCDAAAGTGGLHLAGADGSTVGQFVALAVGPLLFELAQVRGWLGLHAAVVGRGDRAVLLPAPSGYGKSTIARNAFEHGLEVLSDDLIWLTQRGEAFDALAFPRGAPCPPAPGPTRARARLALVVFPQIVAQPDNQVSRLATADALPLLLAQAGLLTPGELLGRRFRFFARLAASLPCYRLAAGRATDAVPDLLLRLLSENSS